MALLPPEPNHHGSSIMLQSARPRDSSTPFTGASIYLHSLYLTPGAVNADQVPLGPSWKPPTLSPWHEEPQKQNAKFFPPAAWVHGSQRRHPHLPAPRPSGPDPTFPYPSSGRGQPPAPARSHHVPWAGAAARRRGGLAPGPSPASPSSRPSLTVLRWELGSGGGCMPARPLALPRASGTAAVRVGTAAGGGGHPPRSCCGCGGALRSAPGLREGGGGRGEGEGAWSAAVKRFRDAGGAARSVRGAEAAGRAAEGRSRARFRHGSLSRDLAARGPGLNARGEKRVRGWGGRLVRGVPSVLLLAVIAAL